MRRIGMMVVALGALAAPLAAQGDPQCVSGNANVQDACNTAVDAVKTFHPLAGMIVSGGNPVLGTARTLGGLGHLSLTARVNAVKVAIPNPDTSSAAAVSGGVPAPTVEAAVGVFRGLGAGLLSVDALGSATLLPTTQVKNLTVDSNATKVGSLALGIGYGVRVGVLRGSFPIPSVSVSVMRRSLPRLRYGTLAPSSLSSGDAFEFDTDLKATNVRVAASMKLLLLDVAVGVGFDKYTSTAHLRFYDNPPTNSVRTVTLDLNNSRQVLFANAGLDVLLLKLVAEIGYQTGKDQRLSTTYADFDPKAGHVYGGVGVRFSL